MNNKVRRYIIALESKLRWASTFIPVIEFIPLDWNSSKEGYIVHIEALHAEVFRVSDKLTILAMKLGYEDRMEERAEVLKCLKALAKYTIDKDVGW